MTSAPDDRVSRSRYNRERAARAEAESLLENKSRELFEANKALSEHSGRLEASVRERTAELELAVVRAEAASMARSRFVATMSHEIRTPLGGLLGMIDLLSLDEADPNKLELLNYAKAAGTGLSRVVNDVLDFSKMEAGVFVFEEEHVDLRALVESARILYGSHGKGISRSILAQIDDSVPRLFLGDATRIRQVISNLLSNALRYSTDGVILLRAGARPHEKGALLRVEVEDRGIGIAADKIGQLFKDFSQIANPLTATAQGTGLGLAICKRIVDGIGGQIGVETRIGVGSTFWFEVPVQVVSVMGADSTAEVREDPAIPPRSLQGKRVLIAEDNLINQRLLLAYAARLGLKADLAENGKIALEKFAPGKYDIILMDIAMPEMDGLEATKRIRDRWPQGAVPPIIALTAHVADAIEQEARLVGIERILSKPIPFAELQAQLVAALNKSTQQDARNAGGAATGHGAGEGQDQSLSVTDMLPEAVVQSMLEVFSLEELSDLAVKFILDSRARIHKLIAADLAGDAEEVVMQAHSLKGSCLALGLDGLADRARGLEHPQTLPKGETIQAAARKFAAEIERLTLFVPDGATLPR